MIPKKTLAVVATGFLCLILGTYGLGIGLKSWVLDVTTMQFVGYQHPIELPVRSNWHNHIGDLIPWQTASSSIAWDTACYGIGEDTYINTALSADTATAFFDTATSSTFELSGVLSDETGTVTTANIILLAPPIPPKPWTPEICSVRRDHATQEYIRFCSVQKEFPACIMGELDPRAGMWAAQASGGRGAYFEVLDCSWKSGSNPRTEGR